MCPVWKPQHDPPKLLQYSYLSQDAQRIIDVLEHKYQNKHNHFSECDVKTEVSDTDHGNYYRSIYEARYKTELRSGCSGSSASSTQKTSHFSNSPINTRFVCHVQPDKGLANPFQNTIFNCNPINSFPHQPQTRKQCRIPQTMDSGLTSDYSLQTHQHFKTSPTPMSSRNSFSHADTPEISYPSTFDNRTAFHSNTVWDSTNQTPETFTNSLTFGSQLNKTTLSSAAFDNHLSEISLEQNTFQCSGDSVTKTLFKIPSASKSCLNKTPSSHSLENKPRNTDIHGGKKTCQMRITESLKQMYTPVTSNNTVTQSSPAPVCFNYNTESRSKQFQAKEADTRSKITNIHLSASSSPSPSNVPIINISPVLFESLPSLSKEVCHNESLLDLDFSHKLIDTLCDHPDLSASNAEINQQLQQGQAISRNILPKSEPFCCKLNPDKCHKSSDNNFHNSSDNCHNSSDKTSTDIGQGFQIVGDKMMKPCIERSNEISKGIYNVNVEKKSSKKRCSTFQAPFRNKISKDDLTMNTIAAEHNVHVSMRNPCGKSTDVISISESERNLLAADLLNSKQICMTQVFSNNSTLLNQSHSGESTKKHGVSSKKVTHIAIKITASSSLNDCKLQNVLLFSLDDVDPGYLQWLRLLLKDLMTNSVPQKIAVNAKEIFVELLRLLYRTEQKSAISWLVQDPVVGAWLLNSEKSLHSLTDVLLMLGMNCPHTESSNWIDNLNTEFTLLHEAMATLEEKLKCQDLWKLFSEVECPLISLLATMEVQQLQVDTKTFITFSDVLKKKLSRLEEKAFSVVGHSFCINSHPQLRQVLYEELRLDKKLPLNTKITKTCIAQQKSTSESMLNQLVEVHPLPAIVLEYRQLQKLKSTYVDGMLACVEDGYLGTHWDQTAAATGRLTSYQPNIQAIPKTSVTVSEFEISYIAGKRNDKKMEIFAREPFISHEGHLLLAADFQQIELRLLAHLSDDPTLLDLFRTKTDEDIFIQLTAQWLKKPCCEVTAAEREQTKRIVYSVMYGVGKEKLSEYLKVSPDNAKAIMQSFLLKFPAVNSFTKKCVEFCQEHGYTLTIFNRQRQIPHIHHPSYQMRAQAARQAVNFCVQGSAADLCKAAMLKVEKELNSQPNLHTKLLVQIHDELVWEVPENELNAVKDIVKAIMEDCNKLCGENVKLCVPIKVSLSSGTSWAHLKTCG